jgi:hypothetical protein
MTFTVKVGDTAGLKVVERVVAGLTPDRLDAFAEREAFVTLRDVVKATPQKWFGQVRKAWQYERKALGHHVVVNRNKIMRFLEEGTGASSGGYIYPKTKKALYIPLKASAAAGWRPGLVYGTDYVLAKRVRGIKARHIVAIQRAESETRMLIAMDQLVTRLANGNV